MCCETMRGLLLDHYALAMLSSPAHDLLRRVFGFNAFRGPQQQIIEQLCAGQDCLVLMPTGGGKSL